MANRVSNITVTSTGWTKCVTAESGAWFRRDDKDANYYIRILDTGDSAPTTAIALTDIKLFRTADTDSVSISDSVDIYVRAESGSGAISVLA